MSNQAPTHHDHEHDDHHGISHVASTKTLLGTFGILMVFTVITVGATRFDLGGNLNLALGMAIAAVKATLVILFFMHLRYDKLFHSILVLGGLLAAALFVGFALMDSNQYQAAILWDMNHLPAAPIGPPPIP
jgi:cytochrome c oxidase subunit IV